MKFRSAQPMRRSGLVVLRVQKACPRVKRVVSRGARCTISRARKPKNQIEKSITGLLMRKILLLCAVLAALTFFSSAFVLAQQSDTQKPPAAKKQTQQAPAEKPAETPAKPEEPKPAAHEASHEGGDKEKDKDKEEHYDMTEVPPVVTHHQLTVDGKLLKYTATTGRLPIKRGDGKIEAEMFYVAYTLEGADAAKRPLTFAFNGGPGSASIWLHMGALGPRKVVLQPDGFMPPAPYRIEDNASTLLDKS